MNTLGYRADAETRSLVYGLPDPEIRDGVMRDLTAQEYTVKDENHLTVVPQSVGRFLDDGQFAELAAMLPTLPPLDVTYGQKLYEISKPKSNGGFTEYERHSLVALATSFAIGSTLSRFSREFGIDFGEGFPHVTLATKPDTEIARRGIGIDSREEWLALRPRIFSANWRAR